MKYIRVLAVFLFCASMSHANDFIVPVSNPQKAVRLMADRIISHADPFCVGDRCYVVADKETADSLVYEGLADCYEPVRYYDLYSDSVIDEQWSLEDGITNWTSARKILETVSIDNSSPIIAIIDTGMALHHDLAGNSGKAYDILIDLGNEIYGYTYHDGYLGTDQRYTDDQDGHGTHVAGIIGAVSNDTSMGSAGMGKMRILPFNAGIKTNSKVVLNSAYILRAIGEIYKLKLEGYPIAAVNMSYGQSTFSAEEDRAMALLYEAGIIAVTAAGNDGADLKSSPSYPASYNYNNIITVAALEKDKIDSARFWNVSNYGGNTSIAAPGSAILSTYLTYEPRIGETGMAYDLSSAQLTGGLIYNPSAGVVYQTGGTITTERIYEPSPEKYKNVAVDYKAELECDNDTCIEITINFYLGETRTASSTGRLGNSEDTKRVKPRRLTVEYDSYEVIIGIEGTGTAVIEGIAAFASERPSGYAELSGTSMAAPFVAGAIGAAAALHKDLTPEQLVGLLYDSASYNESLTGRVIDNRQLDLGRYMALVSACKDNPSTCEYQDYPQRAPYSESAPVTSGGLSCAVSDSRINIIDLLLLPFALFTYTRLRRLS